MTDKRSQLAERLEKLRQSYMQNLPGRLEELLLCWQHFQYGHDPLALKQLYGIAHSLAGSAPSFGFIEIGSLARDIESLIRPFQDTHTLPQQDARYQILEKLKLLQRQVIQMSEADSKAEVDLLPFDSGMQSAHYSPLICLLEDDVELAQKLALQLEAFNYRVHTIFSPDELKTTVTQQKFDALLVDIHFPLNQMNGPDAVLSLGEEVYQSIPIVYISEHDDIDSRLKALRAGGNAYVTKPIDQEELISWLDMLIHTLPEEAYRVLVVDDDEIFAYTTGSILEARHMKVEYCLDVNDVLNRLRSFAPDLVLMDIHMPVCMGSELTAIIRQLSAFVTLPIIYLSSEVSADRQLEALLKGGDGFLLKPVVPDNLVRVATYQAKRYRQLCDLVVKDGLTGLLNHRRIKEQLDIELERAKREGHELSFAMLDMDHFKHVNDTYGHAVGDQALRTLARFLKQHLRCTDHIGRYGGEEFVVILPATSADEAMSILQRLSQHFSALVLQAKECSFQLTFSGGVAVYPQFNTADQLIHAADTVLYEAKSQGRNRVILAENPNP